MIFFVPLGDIFHYGPALHYISSGRRMVAVFMRVIRPFAHFTIEATLYGLTSWQTNHPTTIALVISNVICSFWLLQLMRGKTALAVQNLEDHPLPGLM